MNKTYVKTRGKIFGFIKENPGSTVRQIAEGTGLADSTIRSHLKKMLEGDVVVGTDTEGGVAYSKAEDPRPAKQSLLAGKHASHPDSLRLRVQLLGGGDDPLGEIELGPEHKDRTVLAWTLMVVSREQITPLYDECKVTFFVPERNLWVSGNVVNRSVELGRHGRYIYVCDGVGQPELDWQGD